LRIHVDDPAGLWWRLYRQGVLIAANGLACTSTALDDQTLDRAIAGFARVRPK
jgi:glutamate-1-semialdehyde 2,1-aminomutase